MYGECKYRTQFTIVGTTNIILFEESNHHCHRTYARAIARIHAPSGIVRFTIGHDHEYGGQYKRISFEYAAFKYRFAHRLQWRRRIGGARFGVLYHAWGWHRLWGGAVGRVHGVQTGIEHLFVACTGNGTEYNRSATRSGCDEEQWTCPAIGHGNYQTHIITFGLSAWMQRWHTWTTGRIPAHPMSNDIVANAATSAVQHTNLST